MPRCPVVQVQVILYLGGVLWPERRAFCALSGPMVYISPVLILVPFYVFNATGLVPKT